MQFGSNSKNIMNTIAFNILLVIYSILFVLCIALWIQARKTDAYIKANNPAQRKYVITIVIGISLLIALVVWFMFPEIRYRTVAAILLYIPIALFICRTSTLSHRFRIIGILTSCIYVPMIILYLT